jgi:hypothetical protein
MNSRDRCIPDMLRRIEVRLTGAKADQVATCCLQFGGQREYGAGRGGLH